MFSFFSFCSLNFFYDLHDWTEVDEQELVYPITRDSSQRREEKKEEKACSSSLVVHKMAGSRRGNHFFSSRLSDFDLLLFRARPIFFLENCWPAFSFVYSLVFSAASGLLSTGFCKMPRRSRSSSRRSRSSSRSSPESRRDRRSHSRDRRSRDRRSRYGRSSRHSSSASSAAMTALNRRLDEHASAYARSASTIEAIVHHLQQR